MHLASGLQPGVGAGGLLGLQGWGIWGEAASPVLAPPGPTMRILVFLLPSEAPTPDPLSLTNLVCPEIPESEQNR